MGSDQIPAVFLKLCAQVLGPSLTTLVNVSLTSGIVPSALTFAVVRPLLVDPDVPKKLSPNIDLSYRLSTPGSRH